MPRNYGRFTTGIFRDEDFRALTAAEQGIYFMLGLQPEVTAAGTLSLTLRRWSAMSADMNPEDLSETLSVLVAHGHIIIDFDTEELLIRKFIKWDGGIENSKRRPVVIDSACAIQSTRIREAIAHELIKLGHRDSAFLVWRDAVPTAVSGSDRDGVTKVGNEPEPQPPIPEGEPPEPDSPLAAGEPPEFCEAHMPHGTDAACGRCAGARKRLERWRAAQPARAARAASDADHARSRAVLDELAEARAKAVPPPPRARRGAAS